MKKLLKTLLLILILVGMVFLLGNLLINNDSDNEAINININYSEISQEFDLENITYKAVDYQGNEIIGESYYGVDGTYTKEKPLIKGLNYYTYWLKNDSYYTEATELIIDETHRNQYMIVKSYKKVNLSNDIKVIGRNDYTYNEISFIRKDEYYDMAVFEIIYQAKERTRFPFGAVIIFEYDKQIDYFNCEGIKKRPPYFYLLSSVENRIDAFELEKDIGDWEKIVMNCYIKKFFKKELNNNKIKITIFPNDFYMTDREFIEEYELELGVEDYLMNPLNKPIFEGEILIK